ncbi:uncharacterized protein LOC118320984 [Scomber scombrus]|uniref:Uncharacterized protein LOC118320984 n=1 Tax=Scomber scombrus TaxID=13677 RepID=A0AAV1PPW1_SCOSC
MLVRSWVSNRFSLSILLHGLALLWAPACEASSLGMTVHAVPLNSNGGKTVQAHFTVITPSPCPLFNDLCFIGEDCLFHTTSLPFTGTKPGSGWCVRQWQKAVPSNYKANITLGNTNFYVSMNAAPKIRANSGRLNHPAFVALPPPLRARVNCPHHFPLSVKDLDGDNVRCRFARADKGECVDCTEHSFIELNEEKCTLTFTGKAKAGQYLIYLMAEDLIPVPKISQVTDNKPLSAVPVHLSLTVEESSSSCSAEPVATGDTPKEASTLFVLPYQEVKFDTNFISELESVSEIAVVGPPELFRVGFKSLGSLATMTMGWVRSENNLTRLLPICFTANTENLQSEPRCVWLYQREMRTLPAGTELKCEDTAMSLVLPIASLSKINLDELQLNSPTCPVTYNSTHLTARISLNGCGTKAVHSGSELIYTNTLKSVRPYTMVSRKPSLILPLACRIPSVQAKGPHYKIYIPTDKETFGEVKIWIEFHLPGQGPLAKFTRNPKMRALPLRSARMTREAQSASDSNSTNTNSTDNIPAIGSRLNHLDLHVMSNCSINRAEMIVSNCIESETGDFSDGKPILEQGCTASSTTLEIITTETNSRIYRLDLRDVGTQGSTMYVQCTVNLCIATIPSQKCPDLCTRSLNHRMLVNSVITRNYTVTSGPVSLVVTTPAPTTTTQPTTTTTAAATTVTTTTTTAAAVTTTAKTTTTSHAPAQASAMALGLILATVSVFLQHIFLY